MTLRLIFLFCTITFANVLQLTDMPNGVYFKVEDLISGTIRTDLEEYRRQEFSEFKGEATYYQLRNNSTNTLLSSPKFEAFKDENGIFIANGGKVSKLHIHSEFSWYWELEKQSNSSPITANTNNPSLKSEQDKPKSHVMYYENLMMFDNTTGKTSDLNEKKLAKIMKSDPKLYAFYENEESYYSRRDLYVAAYFSKDYSELEVLHKRDADAKKKNTTVKITMKNGKKYKGRITEENETLYKLNVKGDIVTIYKSVVEKIEFK